jgi:hypothetical protein
MVLTEEFLETHKIICCEYQQKLMIAELSFIDYRLLVRSGERCLGLTMVELRSAFPGSKHLLSAAAALFKIHG